MYTERAWIICCGSISEAVHQKMKTFLSNYKLLRNPMEKIKIHMVAFQTINIRAPFNHIVSKMINTMHKGTSSFPLYSHRSLKN